jgi:putative nucleotidyltransferase with HDIG domain
MDLASALSISPARSRNAPECRTLDHDPTLAAWVGTALEAALRARAPGLHASTPIVRDTAAKVGRELGLGAQSNALLDLAVRVRDIGMLALPDNVVLTTERLTPEEWRILNQHPLIGARVLEGLSIVAAAAPIVRSHHERWDGDGYPDGLGGDAIPQLSRVIAICDAFVAMSRNRPHRRGLGPEVALAHVCRERGAQFDPLIVDALVTGLRKNGALSHRPRGQSAIQAAKPVGSHLQPAGGGQDALTSAIAEFEVVPAFDPALERALETIRTEGSTGGELVASIESDTGLTVAVLRRAQAVPVRNPIVNVPDALAVLTPAELEATIAALPRAEFPWRTSPLEVLLHQTRVHAQAVMRAADRIARELKLSRRDDLLAAALVHDVGKLVLVRTRPDYNDVFDVRTRTPEQRFRQEQRADSLDHATLGGLLIRRWGLPRRLIRTVAEHHSSEAVNDVSTYVRLADMVAHHRQGDAVDRTRMLALCHLCGLSVEALRNVLFDLPHSGGSQVRRADPSPLTPTETKVLRVLAQGKVYKIIAQELGLSSSTVRTHLHNSYEKLGVSDRAQAVLRATEMGWI